MNFVYCDAALISNQGHFSNQCRLLTASLRRRGINPIVLAHNQIDRSLADELGAKPHFSIHPNSALSEDPLAGWIVSFMATARITTEELGKIGGLLQSDILYYDSAKPAQLMALMEWARRFNPQNCPKIIVTFNWFPGVVSSIGEGNERQWHIQDLQSILYRYAGLHIPAELAHRFQFAAFDKSIGEVYSFLTGKPVTILPPPFGAVTEARRRGDKQPLTVSFLGEQRINKGVQAIPGIVRRLLESQAPLRVLVHNSWTGQQPEMDELRAMAAGDQRLQVVVESASGADWSRLLEQSDFIVLPYDQTSYSNCNSGIAWEAMANGIPLAVPARTGMDRMMQGFDYPGVVFESPAPDVVAQAVLGGVARFPELAEKALAARAAWELTGGGARLAEAVLAL